MTRPHEAPVRLLSHRSRPVVVGPVESLRATLPQLGRRYREPVPDFGENGLVDLMEDIPRAGRGTTNANGRSRFGVASPPIVARDVVVTPTVISDGTIKKEAPPGWVKGIDARTGDTRWVFRRQVTTTRAPPRRQPFRGEPGRPRHRDLPAHVALSSGAPRCLGLRFSGHQELQARTSLLAADAPPRRRAPGHSPAAAYRGRCELDRRRRRPETGLLYVPSENRFTVVTYTTPDPDKGGNLRYTIGGLFGGVGASMPRGRPLLKPPYSRMTAIDLTSRLAPSALP